MKCAEAIASLSRARRAKVGCILVAESGGIIAEGYNGTPVSFDNNCEDENGRTKPEVLHAETNCISKVARSNNSSYGSTMYSTVSPCFECAKLLVQAGIRRLVYKQLYRHWDEKTDTRGLILLQAASIVTEHQP